LAIIFEGGALYIALKEFNKARGKLGYLKAVQRGKDPSLFVVLFEDSAAMLGLLIALAGVTLTQITGQPVWDGIASVVIGCILAATAFWLAIETKGLLIGEGADKETVQSINILADAHDEVESVNEILTLHMGPEFILANISIQFKRGLKTGRIEEIIHSLDKSIKEKHPYIKRIFIEAETNGKKKATT
jgi:divalent metal cation (Fe/Co/Zn/Cd) transporter